MGKIVIVDLGTGNLHSVCKAIEHVSSTKSVCITNQPSVIRAAEYLILPGQGAIGTWFNQLQSNPELEQAVRDRLKSGPCLGICLGLQALLEHSEESGGINGLGILGGSVKHFSSNPHHANTYLDKKNNTTPQITHKIPHMGWNEVRQTLPHPLWQGIADRERFYFVHSYYVHSTHPQQIMGQCEYGNLFTAAAAKGNLFATQFHPEKSQHAGLQLLKNFVNWNGDV
ncbi:MAG: imidazole glycerol phosphate synthase subunit HisH [Gammaproteobacteria bacterium]|nr:imidazole glycerol phosphate synthase subunit HisH [Gammaproteobacteria bacterium]